MSRNVITSPPDSFTTCHITLHTVTARVKERNHVTARQLHYMSHYVTHSDTVPALALLMQKTAVSTNVTSDTDNSTNYIKSNISNQYIIQTDNVLLSNIKAVHKSSSSVQQY